MSDEEQSGSGSRIAVAVLFMLQIASFVIIAKMNRRLEEAEKTIAALERTPRAAESAAPATTPPISSQPQTGSSTSSSTALQLVSLETKVTDRSDTFWKFRWTMAVKNTTGAPHRFRAKLKWMDDAKFVIDEQIMPVESLGPNQTQVFSGDVQITTGPAANVKQIGADLELAD